MLFNSISFYLVFLPIALVCFHVLRKAGSLALVQAVLVVASLIFYAGHGADFLGLLIGSVVATFFAAHLIASLARHECQNLAKIATVTAVSAHLGLIGYFKYRNFFAETVLDLFGGPFDLPPLILPLAISFFTFQQIGFLVDVYRGRIQQPGRFLDFALFVTFFPQLIAGPITLYQELKPQFARQLLNARFARLFTLGCAVFSAGLFKKVFVADQSAYHASIIFAAADRGLAVGFYDAWMGALAFTSQIYFDFSGYSEMACGLA